MSKSDPDVIRIECFHCSKVVRASTAMKGKVGSCPRCGKRIHVPGEKKKRRSAASKPSAAKPPLPESEALKVANIDPVTTAPPTTTATESPSAKSTDVFLGIQVLESRSVVALWLLRATMLVMAIQCVIFWLLFEYGRNSDSLVVAQLIVVAIQMILIIATAVFFLRWNYQAYVNLQKACERPLKYSAGWSCSSYFIPILNLFRPAQAMHEVQSRSKANVGYLVYVWWGLWILSGFVAHATLKTSNVKLDRLVVISIVGTSLSIIAGFFLLRIIETVTEKQRRYRLANSDLSIDQWQDSELATDSWISHPLVGTLGVLILLVGLLTLGDLLPNGSVDQTPVPAKVFTSVQEGFAMPKALGTP